MLRRFGALVLAGGVLACAGAYALPVFAQTLLPGFETSLTLSAEPAFPGPNERVHIRARSTYLDLSGADIAWSVDGKTVAAGTGVTDIEVDLGAVGTSVQIDVVATDGDAQLAASTTLAPASVELLVDSNSYVPPFFRGRALPSAGSTLFLEALPDFVRPGGARVGAADLTFTWKRNGAVMGDVSGKGRSRIAIPAPVLYANDTISVVASTNDGSIAAESAVVVGSADVSLDLYQDHPLYGMLYNNAFGASTAVPDSEITLAAIPYFASAARASDARFSYAWNVNNAPVAADASAPNEITLSAGGTAEAAVSLLVTDHYNLFTYASGSWRFTLSGSSSRSPFSNPQ